jgi:hypothetical protein
MRPLWLYECSTVDRPTLDERPFQVCRRVLFYGRTP